MALSSTNGNLAPRLREQLFLPRTRKDAAHASRPDDSLCLNQRGVMWCKRCSLATPRLAVADSPYLLGTKLDNNAAVAGTVASRLLSEGESSETQKVHINVGLMEPSFLLAM